MCKRLVLIATVLAACTAMGCFHNRQRVASYNPCCPQPSYQTGYANPCCCDPCGGMGGGAVIPGAIGPTPVYQVQ